MKLRRAVWALVRRDAAERLSYRGAAALDLAAVAAHALVFFYVAKLVPASANPLLAGYGGRYFPFVLLGIAFVNLQSAAMSGFTQALSAELDTGTIELIWMTPAGLSSVLIAGWALSFFWAAARVAAYLGAGALFFGAGLLDVNILPAAAALILTMASISGLGLLSAAFMLVYKRGDPVSSLFEGASRLLCGVYFPVALLPSSLQPLSRLLPFTFGLEAARKTMLQGLGFGAIGGDLSVLAVWAAVTIPTGVWAFRRAVDRARRDGSLALR